MRGKQYSKLYEWQLKLRDGGTCRKCGDTRNPTVEHIIPVHWVMQFCLPMSQNDATTEWEENFEVLCAVCNREKGGTIDPRHPKTWVLLKELAEKAEKYHIQKL